MCITELNEIVFNSIPNGCIDQAYVQVLYCESITLKAAVKIFERMEISEYIYEGVVEPSDKKPIRVDSNLSGNSSKMIRQSI